MHTLPHVLLVVRWPVGGIKTYLRYMYQQPALRDFRITLVAPDYELAGFLESAGLPVSFVAAEGSSSGLVRAALGVMRRERVDIVHTHGFTAGALMAPLVLMRRIHHVLTSHDVYLPRQFEGWKGRLKRAALEQVLARIECINPVGEDAAVNLLEFMPRLDPRRVNPIVNGVNTGFFADAQAEPLREQLGLSPEVALVGFFGRFMAQKGFRYLVDAVEKLVRGPEPVRPFKVLTYGWGGFIREDFAYLQAKGLGDYFIQMPHTDNMPGAIKAMDLVVMPSLWEACPLLPMEVLSVGVPFIGTDCIGLREVLDGTPAAVVPARSSDALAAAMRRELAEDRRVEFEAFAPEARRRFDVGLAAERLAALYRELLEGRRP